MGKYFLAAAVSVVLWTGLGLHNPVSAKSATAASTMPAEIVRDSQTGFDADKLKTVLADPRRNKDRVRDSARHTAQTMAFFGLSPQSRIVEVLPGGGWYSRVLLHYVTPDGGWYGINYSADLKRDAFTDADREIDEDVMADYEKWPQTYPEKAAKNGPVNAPVKGAFLFGEVPGDVKGTMDAVLFIRALHHLNRINPKYLHEAIADSYALLKPDGIVGVVQHRAREDAPDDYTTGQKGYLKQSYVIEMFENGGFILDGISEVNANPKDTADYQGGVWTLPPSLRGRDQTMKDHYREIGESDRMTLRFRKPS